MKQEEMQIYRELQQHLDKLPVGFPQTQSGVELQLLTHFFTPEEAQVALKLSYSLQNFNQIYDNAKDLGFSEKKFKSLLDSMMKKGSINFKQMKGKMHYGNEILVLGMHEHQVNNLTEEYVNTMNQYINEGFAREMLSTNISQFRIIPVEKSLTPEHHIPTFDELTTIIENLEGPISVANCICRQAKDLLGDPCKVTDLRETCIGFGDIAQQYIINEWGREIDKQEALEILRKNQEAGLVFEVGNAISPHFICSCCGCCCGVLEFLKSMPNTAEILPSNLQAQVDLDLCTGCGTCAQRCQVKAIKIRKEKSKINPKKCIGCGNCVVTCPEEAISLIRKNETFMPPKTSEELYELILNKKQSLKNP